MGWVDQVRGRIVGLDTAPLIYYIEHHPRYTDLVDPLFLAIDRGDLQGITTTITMVEVLTLPLRRGDLSLVRRYRDLLLESTNLTMLPLSPSIGEEAARLRGAHGLRTPDAVQLASAVVGGADLFVTNDTRLASFPDIRVLVLEQLIQQ